MAKKKVDEYNEVLFTESVIGLHDSGYTRSEMYRRIREICDTLEVSYEGQLEFSFKETM